MSSDLTELYREFVRRGKRPVLSSDMAYVLRTLGRFEDQVRDNRQFIEALQDRLLIVDDLPADAPFGALIRLRVGTVGQRASLYLGNGPGQPLSKLVPVAV